MSQVLHKTLTLHEQIGPDLHRLWDLQKVLVHQQTDYQTVTIAEVESHGLTLFCDGDRESSEKFQEIYHEGQIVPAMLAHPNAEKALIIGSSEGVVSQMLDVQGVKSIAHVDIDPTCVKLCAEWLPYGYSVNMDTGQMILPRSTTLHYCDGMDFVESRIGEEAWDVICMDLPDESPVDYEDRPQDSLFSSSFIRQLKEVMEPGGVFITQAGNSSAWRNENLISMWQRMHYNFESVLYFELEEQDWVWMLGTDRSVHPSDWLGILLRGYDKLKYDPQHIDKQTIRKAIIPPISIRRVEI